MKLDNLNNHSTYPAKWTYHVVSKNVYTDSGKHLTYGIKLSTYSANYTMLLHDISTYKKKVMHMVKLFNQYQLSPVHIKDVIEDMIS